jgi:hypothetical protein
MLNSAYIKGAGHSGSDLATQNMMFVAFHPGSASLNPEAAKLPKAFAFNSPGEEEFRKSGVARVSGVSAFFLKRT